MNTLCSNNMFKTTEERVPKIQNERNEPKLSIAFTQDSN